MPLVATMSTTDVMKAPKKKLVWFPPFGHLLKQPRLQTELVNVSIETSVMNRLDSRPSSSRKRVNGKNMTALIDAILFSMVRTLVINESIVVMVLTR